jgi:hypothetical protein
LRRVGPSWLQHLRGIIPISADFDNQYCRLRGRR